MKELLVVLMLLSVLAMNSACSRVESGHVGIKVNLLGSNKGVDVQELGVGRYWIGINEELHVFPTFTQNYVWTKDPAEGSQDDESISFQTVEGMKVSADVGISYSLEPSKVPLIFQKYRKGIDEITDVYLRNMVRDAFVKASEDKPIESVYGKGKSALVAQVESLVRSQVGEIGIIVERIYLVGELRLPPQVIQALNAKVQATQAAQQRENEIRTAEAEAQKRIAEAKGLAQSKREVAQADADAILMKAKAEAEANLLIAESVTKELTEYLRVTQWDGQLPKVTGGVVPMMNVEAN